METPSCVGSSMQHQSTTKSLGMSRLEGISRNTSLRRLCTSKDLPLRELTWLTQCQQGQSMAEHRLALLDSRFQHRVPLSSPQLSLVVFAFFLKISLTCYGKTFPPGGNMESLHAVMELRLHRISWKDSVGGERKISVLYHCLFFQDLILAFFLSIPTMTKTKTKNTKTKQTNKNLIFTQVLLFPCILRDTVCKFGDSACECESFKSSHI